MSIPKYNIFRKHVRLFVKQNQDTGGLQQAAPPSFGGSGRAEDVDRCRGNLTVYRAIVLGDADILSEFNGYLAAASHIRRQSRSIGYADIAVKRSGRGCSIDQSFFAHGVGDLPPQFSRPGLIPRGDGLGEVGQKLTVGYFPVAPAVAQRCLNVVFGTGFLCAHTEQKGMCRRSIGALMNRCYPGRQQFHLHAADGS